MNHHTEFQGMAPEILLERLGHCAVPVDLERLCSELGIRIERTNDWEGGHVGSICMEGDAIVCRINPLGSPVRQRYILAHLIGHYIHDLAPVLADGGLPDAFLDDSKTLKRDGRQDPREYRANDFAARLLMPHAVLLPEVVTFVETEKERTRQQKVARESVFSKMAELFQVSKSAMEIRLINLGIVRRET